MHKKKLVLLILDGFGEGENHKGNGIFVAKTPHFDLYRKKYPFSLLQAAGESVGLPNGQIGSSEVGHTNIGAGRIVYQPYMRIRHAIEHKKFQSNPTLVKALKNTEEKGKALHLIGLFSDAGVHSHLDHFYALIELSQNYKIPYIFVHCILDGRDTKRKAALNYIESFEKRYPPSSNNPKTPLIASLIGRYYAMDRDNRWDRIKKAYDLFTHGKSNVYKSYSASRGLLESYNRGETDEFISPISIINKNRKPIGVLKEEDTVIFVNFRPDRARQITKALTEKEFDKNFFKRNYHPKIDFVCMTEYNKDFNLPIAFPPKKLKNTLGEVLSFHKKKQVRIAETEKYAHITFFLNGSREKCYPFEERILVPSSKVATYDLKPEMSAYDIEEIFLEKFKKKDNDIFIVNLANADMVGHTGVYKASIQAVEILDKIISRMTKEVLKANGILIITADHGNVEDLLDENNKPLKAHTTNPVPFFLISPYEYKLRKKGILADVAPTILELLEVKVPKEMTGHSLLK